MVLAQTTGFDPVWLISNTSDTSTNGLRFQRGDPGEVNLAMVPENHPLIPPRNLEAEASGLLDRVLGIFQENTTYVQDSKYSTTY